MYAPLQHVTPIDDSSNNDDWLDQGYITGELWELRRDKLAHFRAKSVAAVAKAAPKLISQLGKKIAANQKRKRPADGSSDDESGSED